MPAAAIALAAYLDPARVTFFAPAISQRNALIQLAEQAGEEWVAAQRAAFITALFDREAVTTTAIGGGIAVPHARLGHLDRCSITIGLAPGGISWNARDLQPVSLIVLIAARESQPTEHLHLLAAIAALARTPDRCAAIVAAPTPDAAIAAFLQTR